MSKGRIYWRNGNKSMRWDTNKYGVQKNDIGFNKDELHCFPIDTRLEARMRCKYAIFYNRDGKKIFELREDGVVVVGHKETIKEIKQYNHRLFVPNSDICGYSLARVLGKKKLISILPSDKLMKYLNSYEELWQGGRLKREIMFVRPGAFRWHDPTIYPEKKAEEDEEKSTTEKTSILLLIISALGFATSK